MVRSVCCVPGCPNDSFDNPDIDYHHMPVSDKRRRKWLESMGRGDIAGIPWPEAKRLKICGAHFTKDQYRSPLTKKLNITAAPNIFVHESDIPVPVSPTNPGGLKQKEAEEIPTIGKSQVFVREDLKKIISRNISKILRTGLSETPYLTVPATVKTELEEYVEIPTTEPEILPGIETVYVTVPAAIKTELEVFVEIPTTEPEMLPGSETPYLTAPATVKTELEEYVEIPTIGGYAEPEMLPGSETPYLTASATVKTELEEFVETPIIEPEIVPVNR